MTPNICVSILPRNQIEALGLIKQAEAADANLVEVRLDRFDSSLNFKEISGSTKIPLIAANKTVNERGFFKGAENQRQQMLVDAAYNGFSYIDVDLSTPKFDEIIGRLKQVDAKLVISSHNFEGSLSAAEMNHLLQEELAGGASICKIIGYAKKKADNLEALNFVASQSSKAKLVCFLMGEEGRLSRLLSPLFGACFTFASLRQGHETATGQMTIGEMKVVYNLLGV